MVALERYDPGHVGQAWYELGEIELRRGDLAAAADAFDRAVAATGRIRSRAWRCCASRRATSQSRRRCCASRWRTPATPIRSLVGQLLPAIVEAQLACGDVARRRATPRSGSRTSRGLRTPSSCEARATDSRARVRLASGATDDALGRGAHGGQPVARRGRALRSGADAAAAGGSGDAHRRPARSRSSSSTPRSPVFRDLGADARHRSRATPPRSARRRRDRSSGAAHVHVHRHRRLDAAGRRDGRRAVGRRSCDRTTGRSGTSWRSTTAPR